MNGCCAEFREDTEIDQVDQTTLLVCEVIL